MNTTHTRRYYKICADCERSFYTSRKDTKTCSAKCRKKMERNNAYVKRKAEEIKGGLDRLIELLGSDPYKEEAWLYLCGLTAYAGKAVAEKALAGFVTPEESQIIRIVEVG